jgi:hypothetical protein
MRLMGKVEASGVEAALLSLSDACERAARAAKTLEEDRAEGHLVAALRQAETDLAVVERTLGERATGQRAAA